VPEATTLAWAGVMAPSVRAWPVWVRGPRHRARAVRTWLGAAPAPRRRRARSQLVRGGGLEALVGAGSDTGVDGGEFVEPVAFQAVQQPPQPKDPLGPNGVGESV
jgi:hypothetical protein